MRSPVPVALAGVLAIGVAVWGGNGLFRVWHMRQEVEALEREIVALRAETRRLARAVDQLRNEPEATEKIAREEFGLVRPGERVLKFPSTPGAR
jgi:cell division protein FtsB